MYSCIAYEQVPGEGYVQRLKKLQSRWNCKVCDKDFFPEDGWPKCPTCGETDTYWISFVKIDETTERIPEDLQRILDEREKQWGQFPLRDHPNKWDRRR